MPVQRISPCLWFNGQAEEAVALYTRIFPNSRVERVTRYTELGPGPPGLVLAIEFELDGVPLLALNGGPEFPFTEAISLIVHCRTQAEIDHYWSQLSAGGSQVQCGWLKDRFGLSWQVNPVQLPDLLSGDPACATRVMQAIFGMTKIDLATLEAAARG